MEKSWRKKYVIDNKLKQEYSIPSKRQKGFCKTERETMENIGNLIVMAQKLYADAQDAKFDYLTGNKSMEDCAFEIAFYGGFVTAMAAAYEIDTDILKLVIEH